jgi:MFS family permease
MSDADAKHLRDLKPHQWRSGIAAWLGWMFDGLDMHLYTLVALPFVAVLLGGLATSDPEVKEKSAWIQAAFLLGWALGGGFFGRIGDRLGRSKALILTILTYSLFTGLSFFAETWWHLLICRFLAALGIGGEWAVGASLLAETWPRTWRPWLAAILQTGVNVGVMLATLAAFLLSDFDHRYVFLVGLLPALVTLWIRRSVPETEEWHQARTGAPVPGIIDLFRGGVARTTVLTLSVCALGLSAHWAFMFWHLQHLRGLPEVAAWSASQTTKMATTALFVLMVGSVIGNFAAGALSRVIGYRRSIVAIFLLYGGIMAWCYSVPRTLSEMWVFLAAIGLCQGVFALFTMYLPPLFPTLLRTTGAGFCYNIGRIAAAAGTVIFLLVAPVGELRLALLYAALLFVPAAAVAAFLPDRNDATGT